MSSIPYILFITQQKKEIIAMKFWLGFTLLILAFLAYIDYRDFNSTCSIPQFTDEQMKQICIEEGIPLD